MPKISIIIPIYQINEKVKESIRKCLFLDYPNYEILGVVDTPAKIESEDPKIKILATGLPQTGPAEKRDLAIEKAQGEYIVFLDDDSYPSRNWLKKAILALHKNEKVKVICGPGLTPSTNSFSQKLSGAVLTSVFGSGIYVYRFRKEPPRYVDDYPAYNMMVKKSILKKVGGFGTKFYGGEDTALCLKLINIGEKILYIPEMTVYHHRRRFPQGFFKQIANVGKHRGYFVKKYPKTSRRPIYFLPTLFIFSLIPVLILSFLSKTFFWFLMLLFSLLYLIIFGDVLKRNSLLVALLVPFCIALTHMVYGVCFILGLLIPKLKQ